MNRLGFIVRANACKKDPKEENERGYSFKPVNRKPALLNISNSL